MGGAELPNFQTASQPDNHFAPVPAGSFGGRARKEKALPIERGQWMLECYGCSPQPTLAKGYAGERGAASHKQRSAVLVMLLARTRESKAGAWNGACGLGRMSDMRPHGKGSRNVQNEADRRK